MLKTSGGFWCTCGEWNVERTEKRAPSVRVLFHRLRSPFSCPLRWPDVGFVCPVSVSCVFARAQLKQSLCQDFLVFVCIWGVHEAQIYLYRYFFVSFFSKAACDGHFNKQFCKPTDMPMYFSVFLGQKHAAYCEFYLSLCMYGNMIQYAVQLFCFSRDFYLPNNPLFQQWLPHYKHLATVWVWATRKWKIWFHTRWGRYTTSNFELVVAGVEKWWLFFNGYIKRW